MLLYSAVYGDRYDAFTNVRRLDIPAVMYVGNTADARLAENAGWLARVVPLPEIATPMLQAKWWKTHPDLAVPDDGVSVWVDGCITPAPNLGALALGALGDDEWSLTPHPWRTCLYTELDASLGLPKYDDEPMRRQVEHYRSTGHPENWGLFASGAMTRQHTAGVVRASHLWWLECLNRHHQDQLSLPWVLRNSEVRWNARMRWAADFWDYAVHGRPE